jgi:S1-C subfamily serine protease
LILTVGELSVGTSVTFTFVRDGTQQSTTVTIEARRSQAGIQQLYRQLWPGFSAFPLTPEIAEDVGVSVENGVIVGEVQASSPADIAGVQMGDVVTQINDDEVEDLAAFYDLMADDSIEEWELDLVRDGEEITLTVIR